MLVADRGSGREARSVPSSCSSSNALVWIECSGLETLQLQVWAKCLEIDFCLMIPLRCRLSYVFIMLRHMQIKNEGKVNHCAMPFLAVRYSTFVRGESLLAIPIPPRSFLRSGCSAGNKCNAICSPPRSSPFSQMQTRIFRHVCHLQGDPFGWLKNPVDLVPTALAADMQAGLRNIPNPS